ncbi:hypothetical protein ACKS0A_02530 [Histoplasma ohiense]
MTCCGIAWTVACVLRLAWTPPASLLLLLLVLLVHLPVLRRANKSDPRSFFCSSRRFIKLSPPPFGPPRPPRLPLLVLLSPLHSFFGASVILLTIFTWFLFPAPTSLPMDLPLLPFLPSAYP